MKRRKSVVKQRRNNKDLFWPLPCDCRVRVLFCHFSALGEGVRDLCMPCNVIRMIRMGVYPARADSVSLWCCLATFWTSLLRFRPILCFEVSCLSKYTVVHYHPYVDLSGQSWYRKHTFQSEIGQFEAWTWVVIVSWFELPNIW